MMRIWSAAVLMLPALSAWVAERVQLPLVDSAVPSVSVHEPDEQGAAAGVVAAPLIRGKTVATSPGAVPHVPPMDVTVALVTKGNDWGRPVHPRHGHDRAAFRR